MNFCQPGKVGTLGVQKYFDRNLEVTSQKNDIYNGYKWDMLPGLRM